MMVVPKSTEGRVGVGLLSGAERDFEEFWVLFFGCVFVLD